MEFRKSVRLTLSAFVAILVLVSAQPCLAVYPIPDGTIGLQMQQGWYDGNLAWFICTDTSNIRVAQTRDLTLAPKLESAYLIAAPAYKATNPELNQGPVFSTRPDAADYSGIWTVWSVTWTNLDARVPLTSEQQILDAETAGDLVVEPSDPHIVVDCPIVALGRLDGPWLPKPDPPFYRIPQALDHDPQAKRIRLPTWYVFCSDSVSKQKIIRKVIIPDVSHADLASALGANLAPGLLDIPPGDTQRFWVMRQPKPPSQRPVAEFCPEGITWRNTNFDYSPVQQYVLLHRNIPQYACVDNPDFLKMLIGSGRLIVARDDQVINAPILPPKADIKVCSRHITLCVFDWLIPDKDRVTVCINDQPVLKNCKLPWLLWPKCLRVFLKPGDNEVKIIATSKGWAPYCTVGMMCSDVCKKYDYGHDGHAVELFALRKNETATIIIRVP